MRGSRRVSERERKRDIGFERQVNQRSRRQIIMSGKDGVKSSGFMETFKEKLNEIRKTIDNDRYRRRVLLLCQQTEPRSFDEYSSR